MPPKGKQNNYFNSDQLLQAKMGLKSVTGTGAPRKSKLPICEVSKNSMAARISHQMKQSLNTSKKKVKSQEEIIHWVQSQYRAKKIRLLYKEMQKKYRYRRSVVAELIATEQSYVNDLGVIIGNIMAELKQIITNDEFIRIFSNITSLKKLNSDFLEELKTHFACGISQNFHNELTKFFKGPPKEEFIQKMQKVYVGGIQPMAKIGPTLLEFAPFFKIYFQYYDDFGRASMTIEQLKKDNKKFIAYIQQMTKSSQLRFLDLGSYLVKPVQRLPKYVLLIKDLLKHTDQDHPDFVNLQKAYDSYSKVTDQNNSNVDKGIINAKLFELQRLYGDPLHVKLINSKREYLYEKFMSLFWKNKPKSVQVYFLSDLLIVTERKLKGNDENQHGVVCFVKLSATSQVKPLEDTQFFTNLFTVIGDKESLIFIAKDLKAKQKRIKAIEEMIGKLQEITQSRNEALLKNSQMPIAKSSQYPINVQILGTEQRQQLLTSYTVYIIDITIGIISSKVYLRYSELLELSELVKKQFPKVSLAYMKEVKWSHRNDVKEIESRSLQITTFLQTLLVSKQVSEQPQTILEKLTLPQNFYTLPELAEQQINESSIPKSRKFSLKNSQQFSSLQSSYNSSRDTDNSSRMQSRQFGEKVSASQLLRSGGLSAEKIDPSNAKKMSKQQSSLSIAIHSFHQTKSLIQIQVTTETRIMDLFEIVIQELNLKNYFDFKFLINDKIIRPLDDEELVMGLFTQSGLIDKIRKAELQFRKYIYLEYHQEEQQLNQDIVKLEMVYKQFCSEIKNSQFTLSFKEYCLLAAIYLFIEKCQIQKSKFPHDKLTEIIPQAIVKSTKKEIWEQYITELSQSFQESILKEIQSGTQNPYHLAQNVFINTIYQNQLCGLQFFQVGMSKETKYFVKNNENQIWMAIGINGIMLFDSKKRNKFYEIDFGIIHQIKSFTGAICIIDSFEKNYKFETNQVMVIQKLLSEYQNIIEDLRQSQFDEVQIKLVEPQEETK